MKKTRIMPLILALVLMCGCSPKTETTVPETPNTEQTEETVPETPEVIGYRNNLTGENSLENEADISMRPVAVAINNLVKAQSVQTGLEKADIIYETHVEGGITRLLAVFKDISVAGEIGTIRSARYDFVDICEGHDAIYVHAGIDPTYAQPYINKLGIDNANMLNGSLYGYAYRIQNGLALEHTLYSKGENIAKMLKDKGWRTTVNDKHNGEWQNFSDADLSLSGGKANNISVTFSEYYKTTFEYNSATGMYKKTSSKDWRNGNNIQSKNVVVLFTTLGMFGDGYRMKIGMDSGSGYYFTNGTYQKINWKKGEYNESYKFTDESGNQIAYNKGNSYVCIVNKDMQGKFIIGE